MLFCCKNGYLLWPDTQFVNWEAGDICKYDRFDVLDLCLMKKQLNYKQYILSNGKTIVHNDENDDLEEISIDILGK